MDGLDAFTARVMEQAAPGALLVEQVTGEAQKVTTDEPGALLVEGQP